MATTDAGVGERRRCLDAERILRRRRGGGGRWKPDGVDVPRVPAGILVVRFPNNHQQILPARDGGERDVDGDDDGGGVPDRRRPGETPAEEEDLRESIWFRVCFESRAF